MATATPSVGRLDRIIKSSNGCTPTHKAFSTRILTTCVVENRQFLSGL